MAAHQWIINAALSGSVSLFCSSLIIIAIWRSQLKLRNSYNRIMFGMSTMDVIASLAMALTTLATPATDEVYNLPLASGTNITCSLQGLGFSSGLMGSFLYICVLSYYYRCRIRLQMSEESFKRIERKIHVGCILLAATYGIAPLFLEMYNPNSLLSWCIIMEYPMGCDDNDIDNRCIRGAKRLREIFWIFNHFFGVSIFLIMTFCLITTVRSCSTRTNRTLLRESRLHLRQQEEEAGTRQNLIKQALLYESAFMVTYMCMFIISLSVGNSGIITAAISAVLPLQGLFNALIFFYIKVQHIQASTSGTHVTVCKALYYIFFFPIRTNEIQLTGLDRIQSRIQLSNDPHHVDVLSMQSRRAPQQDAFPESQEECNFNIFPIPTNQSNEIDEWSKDNLRSLSSYDNETSFREEDEDIHGDTKQKGGEEEEDIHEETREMKSDTHFNGDESRGSSSKN